MGGYGTLPVVIDPTAWAGRTENASLTIDSIQNQIAAQLTAFFASASLPISVYTWPAFDCDTWWNSNPSKIAFVLISYSDTNLSKPKSTSSMVQERSLRFKVHVEARNSAWNLSGAGSVYALIEAIEAALSGFMPVGCRHGYFTEERFSEQDSQGRVWLYDMTYEVITMRPALLPQYALANLSQLIFNMTPTGEQVLVPPAQ